MRTPIELDNKKILVTGSPGFIGANFVLKLLSELKDGVIVSLDNMNDYYPVALKEHRLKCINEYSQKHPRVQHVFVKGSICDRDLIADLFQTYHFDIIVNLAAQAGVRYSITNPDSYIDSNIIGFYNILEACRSFKPLHLIFASSSSVYGGRESIPFRISDSINRPVSLYAATKISNEIMAYSYSKLYNIPCTGLRFFTVYGPAGRPDMFYFSTTDKFVRGDKIQLYNHGEMMRDFTYIDDIVEGVYRVACSIPLDSNIDPAPNSIPYSIYNIGGGKPENLLHFVNVLIEELISNSVLPEHFDLKKHSDLFGMQPGDVKLTYADTADFEKDFQFRPQIDIQKGLHSFAKWYKEYYCKS